MCPSHLISWECCIDGGDFPLKSATNKRVWVSTPRMPAPAPPLWRRGFGGACGCRCPRPSGARSGCSAAVRPRLLLAHLQPSDAMCGVDQLLDQPQAKLVSCRAFNFSGNVLCRKLVCCFHSLGPSPGRSCNLAKQLCFWYPGWWMRIQPEGCPGEST